MASAWDDRKLNDAYDKALKIANAEVARRVAMSTNTQNGGKVGRLKKVYLYFIYFFSNVCAVFLSQTCDSLIIYFY